MDVVFELVPGTAAVPAARFGCWIFASTLEHPAGSSWDSAASHVGAVVSCNVVSCPPCCCLRLLLLGGCLVTFLVQFSLQVFYHFG